MSNRNPTTLLLLVLATIGAGATTAHGQSAVTTCEQVVTGEAYLPGDLNCPPGTEAAVEIRSGGSLDMRGFSITGGEYGILCSKEGVVVDGVESFDYTGCTVIGGGGTIAGQSVVGIVASRLTLTDVTIDMVDWIALIIHSKLKFSNVTLQLGPSALGIMVGDKVRVLGTGLTMNGGHDGFSGPGVINVDGFTASGNGAILVGYPRSVKLRNASITGGARGIVGAGTVVLRDSTLTGHTGTGIEAARIKLTGSTVTGNGLDLDADRAPKLKSSTCETSNGWGVCTND